MIFDVQFQDVQLFTNEKMQREFLAIKSTIDSISFGTKAGEVTGGGVGLLVGLSLSIPYLLILTPATLFSAIIDSNAIYKHFDNVSEKLVLYAVKIGSIIFSIPGAALGLIASKPVGYLLDKMRDFIFISTHVHAAETWIQHLITERQGYFLINLQEKILNSYKENRTLNNKLSEPLLVELLELSIRNAIPIGDDLLRYIADREHLQLLDEPEACNNRSARRNQGKLLFNIIIETVLMSRPGYVRRKRAGIELFSLMHARVLVEKSGRSVRLQLGSSEFRSILKRIGEYLSHDNAYPIAIDLFKKFALRKYYLSQVSLFDRDNSQVIFRVGERYTFSLLRLIDKAKDNMLGNAAAVKTISALRSELKSRIIELAKRQEHTGTNESNNLELVNTQMLFKFIEGRLGLVDKRTPVLDAVAHLPKTWFNYIFKENVRAQDNIHHPAEAPFNDVQNTHNVSVHRSVSESAEKLLTKFGHLLDTEENKVALLDGLKSQVDDAALNIRLTDPDDMVPKYAAQRCFHWLRDCEYMDPTSGVKLKDLMALIAQSISQEEERIASHEDAVNALIQGLYETQRGYNFNNAGEDSPGADRPICHGGAFNKLINCMQGVLKDCNVIFINRATILSKFSALASAQAENRLNQHIENLDINNALEINGFSMHLNRIRDEGISCIWELIRDTVSEQLIDEFKGHELMVTMSSVDRARNEFMSIIDSGRSMRLPKQTLDRINETFQRKRRQWRDMKLSAEPASSSENNNPRAAQGSNTVVTAANTGNAVTETQASTHGFFAQRAHNSDEDECVDSILVAYFFEKHPPACFGTFWTKDNIVSATIEDLLNHAQGHNQLKSGYKGTKTRENLESCGIDFDHLNGLTNQIEMVAYAREQLLKIYPVTEFHI